ncbi:conserved Plasmodium protein, unknown function [Plasmodium ovale wallikeri]|uniref:Uncharacterized protein n=1 Tax=Plasmodium ovale wallikeri TaxID=864142 RepID=A0A1A8YWN5_PLAOA|nr:conserved Plasmodium protein, unknown function [Plasmodium ovale wallikeri]SBT36291.1 conserved Plasmodium protein, unknown function [Plasmodium ovale wallikeri]
MNPLLEYKRIKQAVFNKCPVNLKKEIRKNENLKTGKGENVYIPPNRDTEINIRRNIPNASCHITRNKCDNHVAALSKLSWHKKINEHGSDDNEWNVKSCEAVQSGHAGIMRVYEDDAVGDPSIWNNAKINSNVNSNLRDISSIMEEIRSNKKRQEDVPNRAQLGETGRNA